jgi:hypothetical protein
MVDFPGKNRIVKPEIQSFGCVLVFLDTDEGTTDVGGPGFRINNKSKELISFGRHSYQKI